MNPQDSKAPRKIMDISPTPPTKPSKPASKPDPEPDEEPSNIPHFGEFQQKVDDHPLFSGAKEPAAPHMHKSLLKKTLWPVVALLVALVLLYLAIDTGLIRGYSHLPFHIFKTPTSSTKAPAISPTT